MKLWVVAQGAEAENGLIEYLKAAAAALLRWPLPGISYSWCGRSIEKRCLADMHQSRLDLTFLIDCAERARRTGKLKSSGRAAVVVVQHAAEALLSLNLPCTSEITRPRLDDPVSQALVIEFLMIMRHEFVNCFA